MHTHTVVNTLRRPGSSWGLGALLKGLTSVVVLKVERALVIQSPHRQFLVDLRLKPATLGLQVRLYPLGHDSHTHARTPHNTTHHTHFFFFFYCHKLTLLILFLRIGNEKVFILSNSYSPTKLFNGMFYSLISRQEEPEKIVLSSDDEISLSDKEEVTVVKIGRRSKHSRTTRSTSKALKTRQKGSRMVKTSAFYTHCDNFGCIPAIIWAACQ